MSERISELKYLRLCLKIKKGLLNHSTSLISTAKPLHLGHISSSVSFCSLFHQSLPVRVRCKVLPTACPSAPPCSILSPPYSMPKSSSLHHAQVLPTACLSPPCRMLKSSLQHAQVPSMPALHSACINSNAQGQAVLCDEYCLSGGLRKCLACGFQKQWVTLCSGW